MVALGASDLPKRDAWPSSSDHDAALNAEAQQFEEDADALTDEATSRRCALLERMEAHAHKLQAAAARQRQRLVLHNRKGGQAQASAEAAQAAERVKRFLLGDFGARGEEHGGGAAAAAPPATAMSGGSVVDGGASTSTCARGDEAMATEEVLLGALRDADSEQAACAAEAEAMNASGMARRDQAQQSAARVKELCAQVGRCFSGNRIRTRRGH